MMMIQGTHRDLVHPRRTAELLQLMLFAHWWAPADGEAPHVLAVAALGMLPAACIFQPSARVPSLHATEPAESQSPCVCLCVCTHMAAGSRCCMRLNSVIAEPTALCSRQHVTDLLVYSNRSL